jgi:hypothetical protein
MKPLHLHVPENRRRMIGSTTPEIRRCIRALVKAVQGCTDFQILDVIYEVRDALPYHDDGTIEARKRELRARRRAATSPARIIFSSKKGAAS